MDDSESEESACPLCTELLDATDRACEFCQCGYAMCLWCWHQLMENAAKENLSGRCPNCRAVYDKDKITQQAMQPSQLEEVAKEAQRKKPERKTSGTITRPRRDLASVRVVQRNLVYVVGLSMDICHEDMLRTSEYFGQFGKPVKVSVNRSMPAGMAHAKGGASGSAYVTFRKLQDAQRCVETVDGIVWSGRIVRACFGTTKYCNAFLKGIVCNNTDCLYLHAVAEDGDSFTKEAMLSGASASNKFASLTQLPPKVRPLGAAPPMHSATASSSVSQPIAPPPPQPLGSAPERIAAALLPPSGRLLTSSSGGSGSGGAPSSDIPVLESPTAATSTAAAAQGSWAAVFTAPSTPVAIPPPRPPGEPSNDPQEWPTLGGGAPAAVAGATNGHSSGGGGGAAEQQQEAATEELQSGGSMAVQLARAHSEATKQATAGGARTAASKKAQQGALPGRGRGAKTLVPPPPPLLSALASETPAGPTALGLTGLTATQHGIKGGHATVQLMKAPPRPLPARLPVEAALSQPQQRPPARGAPVGNGTNGMPAEAPLLNAQPAPPDAGPIIGVPLAEVATVAPTLGGFRSAYGTAPPRLKAFGPPPGFDRGRALATRDPGAGQQPQYQAAACSDHMGGYAQSASLGGGGGGAGAAAAGRTQSRFLFARGSGPHASQSSREAGGCGPPADLEQRLPPGMAHMGHHPAAGGPAFYTAMDPSPSSAAGEALLRRLQQSAGGSNGVQSRVPAPPPLGMHVGPTLLDPSILSLHAGVPGLHPQPLAAGMGNYMPGLTSGFRPGSRGPPPGFAGYQPAQHAEQGPPQLNGGAVPRTHAQPAVGSNQSPAGNGFSGAHPLILNGGGHAETGAAAPVPNNETSPAKGRRRKGKAAPSVMAPPSAVPHFSGGAILHDPDIQAGRLQQARERFYSLNS